MVWHQFERLMAKIPERQIKIENKKRGGFSARRRTKKASTG
jgi:hypothetical protein